MPRFKIEVTEHVSCRYAPVWIEAESESDAKLKAEHMRIEGKLQDETGDSVDDVEFDVLDEQDDEP